MQAKVAAVMQAMGLPAPAATPPPSPGLGAGLPGAAQSPGQFGPAIAATTSNRPQPQKPAKPAQAPGMAKKAYYPMGYGHPGMGFGGNMTPAMAGVGQFGFPQGSHNNALAMNPSFYPRAGVGGMGMHVAPHLAAGLGGMGPVGGYGFGYGMGMRPFGMGHGGFGGPQQPGMAPFGSPPMSEEVMRENYNRRRAEIVNMAGQFDPNTGRPFTHADIDRLMKSLNADTTRSLQTMRLAHSTYGTPTPFDGRPSGMPGMGMHHPMPGMMPGMGMGMGMGMPGMMPPNSYGYGGGLFGQSHSPETSDTIRNKLYENQTRTDNSEMAAETGQGSPISRQDLETQRNKLREMALNTNLSDRASSEYVDPLSGKPMQFAARHGLSSLFLPYGAYREFATDDRMGGTDYKKFRNEWDDYNDKVKMFQKWQQQQRSRATAVNTRDNAALEGKLKQRVGVETEDQQMELEKRRLMLAHQKQMMSSAFGMPASPPAGSPATPPATGGAPAAPSPAPAPGTPPAAAGAPVPTPAPVPAPTPGAAPDPAAPPVMAKASAAWSRRITPMTNEQLYSIAARGLVSQHLSKEANAAKALRTLAYLTGGGALAGGLSSAVTAPQDYAPEAMLRGARHGAIAGAGAALGGAAGGMLGKGYANIGGRPHPAISAIYGGAGKVMGGVGGGASALMAAHSKDKLAPWESGEMPLLEQLDRATRRRNQAPAFKTAAARTLHGMGLLKAAADADGTRAIGEDAGRIAAKGLLGAGVGATGGSLMGAYAGALNKMPIGRHARVGAMLGSIPGALTGLLTGAHKSYTEGADGKR